MLVPALAARCLGLFCQEGFGRSLFTTADLSKDVALLAMQVFLLQCESSGDFCFQWQTRPCSGGFAAGGGAGSARAWDGSLGKIIIIIIKRGLVPGGRRSAVVPVLRKGDGLGTAVVGWQRHGGQRLQPGQPPFQLCP